VQGTQGLTGAGTQGIQGPTAFQGVQGLQAVQGLQGTTASLSSIVDNGNATAITIDASENVLIGTTSTGAATASNGAYVTPDGQIIGRSDGIVSYLNRRTTDGQIMQFMKDGAAIGSIGVDSGDNLTVSSSVADHGGLYMGTNTVIPMSGGVATSGTVTLGNTGTLWKDLYVSDGVHIGGTGAANLLNDYEEGTFTPTVEGGTTAGTATYSQQQGSYTKVGNLVTVSIRLNYSGGNGNGSLQVKGLPFTVLTTYLPVFNVYTVSIDAPSTTFPAGFSNLANGIQLVQNQTGGNSGPTLAYDGAGEILISGSYTTND
jgi:hypothetical protein